MRKLMVLLIFALLAIAPLTAQDDAGVLNIYSSRHYGAMEAPFVEFQMATGIEVRVSSGTPRDLLGRLSADVERGNRSVADVFLAIDAGVLSLATERGLLQPVESEILSANIPEDQRDPDGHWYGMSQRVRTVVYYPFDGEHGLTEEEVALLETYADVANPVFEGRLCMRPASHIYTVSLVSSLIHNLGEEEAQAVVEGWTRNTTRYINSDTRQIEAVAAGECDLAVVNHYYVARLRDSADADEVALAESVVLKWLNQDTTGAFYNINGAGVVVNAANYDNAVAFLEWMSGLQGQSGSEVGFPGSNYEFPTNPEAEINETVAALGPVELDLGYPLWEYGSLQQAAVDILTEADFGFSEN